MDIKKDGICITSVTGGILNFGGAVFIKPISVSKSIVGPGGGNTGTIVITNSR
ncbi:spore germination protein [Cytobacillus dafuensis]|uniref:spore germination protein n=1 Tax=Cytobacillus dafuensis TaxID=1742359 RepID=UPI000A4B95AF|nr:spore germination protein [Cytobacillus dafuensis]